MVNRTQYPITVLKTKGKKIAKTFTLGIFGPPDKVNIFYSHIPDIDEIIAEVSGRIIIDLPGIVFANRQIPPTKGGIFIPIRDDFGDLSARGIHLTAPSIAIINRMNDVAQAIWELIRRGELINPIEDINAFGNELNKLVKRNFAEFDFVKYDF
ncbi:hypothetical protein CEE45_01630 [Candidatus Heimdallarchaeota archaeon B3_Heim]|nr:MAG: hypothetical protein CEE45_01630 [Candidatus Heimdallarchaeota archaeon B3_Heim]